jgi:hypothetical protein
MVIKRQDCVWKGAGSKEMVTFHSQSTSDFSFSLGKIVQTTTLCISTGTLTSARAGGSKQVGPSLASNRIYHIYLCLSLALLISWFIYHKACHLSHNYSISLVLRCPVTISIALGLPKRKAAKLHLSMLKLTNSTNFPLYSNIPKKAASSASSSCLNSANCSLQVSAKACKTSALMAATERGHSSRVILEKHLPLHISVEM